VRGVGQHMDADETEEEFALLLQHRINTTVVRLIPGDVLSNFDIS
jgi:hypothetical protein